MATTGSKALKIGAWAVAAFAASVLGAYWLLARNQTTPLDEGRAAYGRGDYRQARSLALKLLIQSPTDPDAKRMMARTSGRLGDDQTAQQLFGGLGERAMEAEDYFVLSSSLERQGQVAPAIVVLERARKLEPDHAEVLHSLARLYARNGRLADAVDAAGRLAGRPGWETRGSLILGILDVKNSDPAGAASALDRALKADPKLTGGIASPLAARKILARSLLETSTPGQALTTLEPVMASGADPEASWLSSRAFLQNRDAARAMEALTLAGDFGKDDPTRPEPAAYLGADACARCHQAIYQSQRGSRHSRSYSGSADLKGLALPAHPIVDATLPGTSHSLRHEGEAVRLTTRTGDREMSALIAFAVGSGDRGLTMVARDKDGLARVCRISAYQDGTVWDMTSHATSPHPDDPGGPLGRPMSADATEKCIDCHVTSLRSARDRRAPEAADRGIGCERCHGPGGNHLAAVSLNFPDIAIARPARATADQITQLCGACHKADDPSTTESDPRFVRFQATTLPMSRCYTESKGAMSCVTCHDPHRDAERKPAAYEALCLSCHANTSREPSKENRHARLAEGLRRVPCPINPTTDCLKCHMPKVEGAAPHTSFTDHQIRRQKVAPVGE